MLVKHLRESNRISDKAMKQLKAIVLPMGIMACALGLIMNRFFAHTPASDFIAGFLIGLSIVLNLIGVYLVGQSFRHKLD